MTVDRTDAYAALGLTPRASQDQVRRAYRALVRRNHPDTRVRGNRADDAASDAALQQVIAAYAILADPAPEAKDDRPSDSPRTSSAVRVRPRIPFPRNAPDAPDAPDQPPIQAGPVRWHGYRSAPRD